MLKILAEYDRDTSPEKLTFLANIIAASLLGVPALLVFARELWWVIQE
jgi:hypothetical protein